MPDGQGLDYCNKINLWYKYALRIMMDQSLKHFNSIFNFIVLAHNSKGSKLSLHFSRSSVLYFLFLDSIWKSSGKFALPWVACRVLHGSNSWLIDIQLFWLDWWWGRAAIARTSVISVGATYHTKFTVEWISKVTRDSQVSKFKNINDRFQSRAEPSKLSISKLSIVST